MLSKNIDPDWQLGEYIEYDRFDKARPKELDTVFDYMKEKDPLIRRRDWVNELRSLIPNLLHAYEKGVNLQYSIGKNDKARRTAKNKLKEHGLIHYRRGRKFGEKGPSYRCKLMPTPLFYDLFHPLIWITRVDEDGKEAKSRYEDPKLMQRIFDYNEFMKDHEITDGNGSRLKTALHRCYKEEFGKLYRYRFHQPSYQSLPDKDRSRIKIDGEDVVRFDLKASHAQILYHLNNETMPDDPYNAFPDSLVMRDVCKCALLMIFNTGKRRSAEKAFEKELRGNTIHYLEAGHYMKQNGIRTGDIFDRVEALNPRLKQYFYTASCRKAMDIEASLLFKTMQILIRDFGVPSIQVFDELVVPASAERDALNTLNKVWESYLKHTPTLTIERPGEKENKIIPFHDPGAIDWKAVGVNILGA